MDAEKHRFRCRILITGLLLLPAMTSLGLTIRSLPKISDVTGTWVGFAEGGSLFVKFHLEADGTGWMVVVGCRDAVYSQIIKRTRISKGTVSHGDLARKERVACLAFTVEAMDGRIPRYKVVGAASDSYELTLYLRRYYRDCWTEVVCAREDLVRHKEHLADVQVTRLLELQKSRNGNR